MNRLFVFGCSMTNYAYATWADLICDNFDEYYNYGRPGASNVFIMNRVLEANIKFNFNKNDMVIVMFSGIGRFSYYKEGWITDGDLYPYLKHNKNKILEAFVKDIWDDNHAVYISWIALNAIKNTLKDIPHKFLVGINNSEYLNNNIIDEKSIEKVKDLMDTGINKTPFDVWFHEKENRPEGVKRISEIYTQTNREDGHPSQRMHYEFIKTFLPEYDNDKTKSMFEYVDKIYDGTNQHIQTEIFNQLFKVKYDKAFFNPLF